MNVDTMIKHLNDRPQEAFGRVTMMDAETADAIIEALKVLQALAEYCEDRFCWKSEENQYEYMTDAVYLDEYRAATKEEV